MSLLNTRQIHACGVQKLTLPDGSEIDYEPFDCEWNVVDNKVVDGTITICNLKGDVIKTVTTNKRLVTLDEFAGQTFVSDKARGDFSNTFLAADNPTYKMIVKRRAAATNNTNAAADLPTPVADTKYTIKAGCTVIGGAAMMTSQQRNDFVLDTGLAVGYDIVFKNLKIQGSIKILAGMAAGRVVIQSCEINASESGEHAIDNMSEACKLFVYDCKVVGLTVGSGTDNPSCGIHGFCEYVKNCNVTGGYNSADVSRGCVAIGSKYGEDCIWNYVVEDSVINNTNSGAGIGSGYSGAMSGTITASGCTITLNGTSHGAGIGGGYSGAMSGTITASGCTITLSGTNSFGAGIGSGSCSDVSGTITASGCTITISGSNSYGAGIGSGDSCAMSGTITASGCTITISCTNSYGAGIGSGYAGAMSGDMVVINSVVSITNPQGTIVAIGSGDLGTSTGNILLIGSKVKSIATTGACTLILSYVEANCSGLGHVNFPVPDGMFIPSDARSVIQIIGGYIVPRYSMYRSFVCVTLTIGNVAHITDSYALTLAGTGTAYFYGGNKISTVNATTIEVHGVLIIKTAITSTTINIRSDGFILIGENPKTFTGGYFNFTNASGNTDTFNPLTFGVGTGGTSVTIVDKTINAAGSVVSGNSIAKAFPVTTAVADATVGTDDKIPLFTCVNYVAVIFKNAASLGINLIAASSMISSATGITGTHSLLLIPLEMTDNPLKYTTTTVTDVPNIQLLVETEIFAYQEGDNIKTLIRTKGTAPTALTWKNSTATTLTIAPTNSGIYSASSGPFYSNRVNFVKTTIISTVQLLVITGPPFTGSQLTANLNGIPNYFNQWKYSDTKSGTYTDITGATGQHYNPDKVGFYKFTTTSATGAISEAFEVYPSGVYLNGGLEKGKTIEYVAYGYTVDSQAWCVNDSNTSNTSKTMILGIGKTQVKINGNTFSNHVVIPENSQPATAGPSGTTNSGQSGDNVQS